MTRNVHPLFPGEDRFTNRVTSNNSYGPTQLARILAEAEHHWDNEAEASAAVHEAVHAAQEANVARFLNAPDWSYPDREGYFNAVKDGDLRNMHVDRDAAMNRFPALKSQAQINAEEFEFSPLAYVVMFSAAASVALIIAGFEWLVGAW